MPFELTPFFPRLTRYGATTADATTAENTAGKN